LAQTAPTQLPARSTSRRSPAPARVKPIRARRCSPPRALPGRPPPAILGVHAKARLPRPLFRAMPCAACPALLHPAASRLPRLRAAPPFAERRRRHRSQAPPRRPAGRGSHRSGRRRREFPRAKLHTRRYFLRSRRCRNAAAVHEDPAGRQHRRRCFPSIPATPSVFPAGEQPHTTTSTSSSFTASHPSP
jgi:hypothetical protein